MGKTTLTVNVAAAIAATGKRVLLIDSDPQSNLTSYLVEENVVDDLLDHSDEPGGSTLWSAVKPIVEATGDVAKVAPIETSEQGLYLVPGDIRLAEFESELTTFWNQCYQRRQKGFRGTAALSSLITMISDDEPFDFAFYDSGPNIGPLNRSILLDCDFFVVPVACDLFSLRALKTLGRTLAGWIREWSAITALAPVDIKLLRGSPVFLGYIPQRFKVYGGQLTAHHQQYLSQIQRSIYSEIVNIMRDVSPSLAPPDKEHRYRLGQVKDFGRLIPASQGIGVALHKVEGVSDAEKTEAREAFREIAENIVDRVERG